MSHTAEIIAVGTELLLGNIANTNAQALSESLSTLGIDVFWHTVVGDNPERLREALAIARRRADIILCPVNCNSHGACVKVKNLAKKHHKTFYMLPNGSLSTISRLLGGHEGETS